MNHITHLRKQVKTAILAESKMTPEERRMHQWQFLCTIGDITYLVGKGGANTMFYRIGDGELFHEYPEALLEKMKLWGLEKYVHYSIVDPDTQKIIKHSADIEVVLAKKPKKYKKYRIFGSLPNGKYEPLYELRSSMVGYNWVKL